MGVPNGPISDLTPGEGEPLIQSAFTVDELALSHYASTDASSNYTDKSKLINSSEDTAEYTGTPFWSWDYFGVYYQYIALGVFYGSLNPLLYPLFSKLLELPSFRVKGAYQVMIIWWSFKMFLGCISDCYPIFGYRRKPYIIIGWVGCIAVVLGLSTLGQPVAGDAAWPYILGFSAMTFFYIVADVAMDGMVTDLAQREPVEKRGHIQSAVYICRYISTAITSCIVAFGFSDERYGGNLPWAFELPQYLLMISIVGILGLYPYYRVKEDNSHSARSYVAQIKKVGTRIQLNAVWRVMLFSFTSHFFMYITNINFLDIEREWCQTEPWVDGVFTSFLSQALVAGGIYFTKKRLLNVSWRKVLSICIVIMAILIYTPSIFYDLNIFRNQFFCAGAPVAAQLILGILFIVSTFCAVEVAEKGYEGITYGMLTTVGNLTLPFTNIFTTVLSSAFDIRDENGKLRDDEIAHHHMFYLDTCIFVLNLLGLVTLFLLPDQKHRIQELLLSGKRSKLIGGLVIVFFLCAMLWSYTANFLLIFESTSCLRIVGGKGCK